MNKRNALVAAALFGAVAISGCCNPMAEYETSIVSGDYAKAVSIATEEIDLGDNDELMWRLMAGSASRLAGDSETAVSQFDKAEDTMIEHDGESVFSRGATGAWAMITNDKAFPYDGGGQDRIMTCLYKAIEFAAQGRSDAARTELNRAAQHQENWLHERRKEIAEAQERLEKDAAAYKEEKKSSTAAAQKASSIDASKVVKGAFSNDDFISQISSQAGFDMASDGILENLQPVDWINPYASHVTGVFRWLNGDECRNYFMEAATCSQKNPTAVRDFTEVDQGVRPQNQIWVWLEDGLGPKREQWRIDLPLVLIPWVNKYVMYAGMAFPKLVYRESAGSGWRIGTEAMSELVDMDVKMKTEFDVYFRAALTREITRVVLKIGTQVALGVVAENVDNTTAKYALKASQVAAAVWAASVTGADTRSWIALPKKVYVARVTRPADGRIVLSGAGGVAAEITVPEGNSMVFVSKPSLQAQPAVKVVTYP